MPTGTIKWFNDDKGYGFIQPDEKGNDLFVHHSETEGYALNEGDAVHFLEASCFDEMRSDDIAILATACFLMGHSAQHCSGTLGVGQCPLHRRGHDRPRTKLPRRMERVRPARSMPPDGSVADALAGGANM